MKIRIYYFEMALLTRIWCTKSVCAVAVRYCDWYPRLYTYTNVLSGLFHHVECFNKFFPPEIDYNLLMNSFNTKISNSFSEMKR